MGQPLRRRHDWADRLLLRLLRHARLRCSADARDGFPLSAVLSAGRRRAHCAGRHPARESWTPRSDRSWPGGRCSGDASGACCRGSTRSADDTHLAQAQAHYAKARRQLDDLAAGTPGRRTDPPAADRQGNQRPGRRRRHLHLRCRAADSMGRALSRDERQAPAPRLLLAWLDGQCHGPGDRRAGRLSRAAGDLALRRRRLHHADGRSSSAWRSSNCR